MPLRNWLGLLILSLVICIPIFAHLEDQFPLMLWDEGRLANSAIEMYETGEPIVVTYDYKPETWSTKPPLQIWIQTLSLKLFGITDLSFRLPVAIAAFLTCIFIYFFCRKKLNGPWLGIIAVSILICSPGYVREHGIRTGDYDGLLTLFTTISVLCFYLYIETDSKKQFWFSVAALILAALTKGIAGLLFLPAMALYAVYRRKLVSMLKGKELYLGAATFTVFVIGYYLLRERYDPGYISAVLENEVGGRYSEAKEGHWQPPIFYFKQLVIFTFKPFFIFLVLGIAMTFINRWKEFKSLYLYLLLCSFGYMLVITGSSTKHSWYIIPVLPLISIISALPIYSICLSLYRSEWLKKYMKFNILPYLFLVAVICYPFANIVKSTTSFPPQDEGWLRGPNDMGRVFQRILRDGYAYDKDMRAIFDEFQSPLKWYMKACKVKKMPVQRIMKVDELLHDELLIVYNDSIKGLVENNYRTHVVEQRGTATIYLIHGKNPGGTAVDSSAGIQ